MKEIHAYDICSSIVLDSVHKNILLETNSPLWILILKKIYDLHI